MKNYLNTKKWLCYHWNPWPPSNNHSTFPMTQCAKKQNPEIKILSFPGIPTWVRSTPKQNYTCIGTWYCVYDWREKRAQQKRRGRGCIFRWRYGEEVAEWMRQSNSLVCCRGKRRERERGWAFICKKVCYLLNGEKTVFFLSLSATILGFKLILDVPTPLLCLLLIVAECRVSS